MVRALEEVQETRNGGRRWVLLLLVVGRPCADESVQKGGGEGLSRL